MRIGKRFKSLAILLAGLLLPLPAVTAVEQVADVRTVIDISGSMKKNDPNNLRRPALKLLVELMPENSQSGVWMFGQYVNMAVRLGKVDAKWKKLARSEAGKIHSRGMYTNIEDAISKASSGWNKPDAEYQRSMILLTDGMVDISKDDTVNKASRQRIINELLPRLKRAGAKIHIIALSKDVDHELLKTISSMTGGRYEQVDSAKDLHRIFLRLFEKSAPVDSLPIKENSFLVDKHVKDMTLVLFRKEQSQSAKIITPDNKVITQQSKDKRVRWFKEASYELITIKRPQSGEWRLETKADPDNRVMVVTNLRMKVDALPNNILLGDKLNINARLFENGKLITTQDFLRLVSFAVNQERSSGETLQVNMQDDGVTPDTLKQDGVYVTQLQDSLVAGEHMLTIESSGPTFKRVYRHLVNVLSTPAEIQIEKNSHTGNFDISLLLHLGILQAATISAQITLSDGKNMTFVQQNENVWAVQVPASYEGSKAGITLVGIRMDDKPLKLEFEKELIDKASVEAIKIPVKTEAPAEPEKTPAPPVSKKDDVDEHEDKEETSKAEEINNEDISWSFVILMIVGINIVILGGAYAGYRIWNKREKKQEVQDEEEIML